MTIRRAIPDQQERSAFVENRYHVAAARCSYSRPKRQRASVAITPRRAGFVQALPVSGLSGASRCGRLSGMPDIVTAAQIAADLDVNVKRLVRWLRAERERGHELLAGRPSGARWAFSREHG